MQSTPEEIAAREEARLMRHLGGGGKRSGANLYWRKPSPRPSQTDKPAPSKRSQADAKAAVLAKKAERDGQVHDPASAGAVFSTADFYSAFAKTVRTPPPKLPDSAEASSKPAGGAASLMNAFVPLKLEESQPKVAVTSKATPTQPRKEAAAKSSGGGDGVDFFGAFLGPSKGDGKAESTAAKEPEPEPEPKPAASEEPEANAKTDEATTSAAPKADAEATTTGKKVRRRRKKGGGGGGGDSDWEAKYRALREKHTKLKRSAKTLLLENEGLEEEMEVLQQLLIEANEVRTQLEVELSEAQAAAAKGNKSAAVKGSETMRAVLRATAIANFKGDAANRQLTFSKGDVIIVFDRHPSGWWTGMAHGESGFFPGSFCKLQKKKGK